MRNLQSSEEDGIEQVEVHDGGHYQDGYLEGWHRGEAGGREGPRQRLAEQGEIRSGNEAGGRRDQVKRCGAQGCSIGAQVGASATQNRSGYA
jgi:hypothetical protein